MASATTAADADAGTGNVGDPVTPCASKNDEELPGGVNLPVTPLITLDDGPIVIVKRPYTNPKRRQVTLGADDGTFDGSGTLGISGNAINFFDAATGGNSVSDGANFRGGQLINGAKIFAEGSTPSTKMDDVVLTLTLTPGTKPVKPPVKQTMTAVRVTLDICMGRTSPTTDPAPLSPNDKIAVGRFLQVQKSNLCDRAMLIVRKAEPVDFGGKLVLIPLKATVQAFAATDEVPSGQSPLPARHLIDNGPIDAAAGTKRWAEATGGPSGNPHDTGFQLGIDGVDDDGDHVAITSVVFSKIAVKIHPSPSLTPANMTLAGFPAPVDHLFTTTGIDEDFAVTPPLVLMRNAQPDIALQVTAQPAGLPIRWQAIRNPQDHANLGNAGAIPTVTLNAGDPTQCTLAADNKGSFRIRAFLDVNNTNTYNPHEPSIPLNLVLADATLQADNTAAHQNKLKANGVNGGVTIKNGLFTGGLPEAGLAMEVLANVTGGGADGRLGLDKVFAGLVNVLHADTIHVVYHAPMPSPVPSPPPQTIFTVENIYPANGPSATGTFAGGRMFKPADPAAQTFAFAHLDSGRPNAGTGGEAATMNGSGPSAFDPAPANAAVGQTYTIRCIDSPSRFFHRVHPDHATALLESIHYAQEFVANFCFWTNLTPSRAPTNSPAERVYCVLRIVPWSISGDWTVNSAAAVPILTPVAANPHKIQTGASSTINPIGRAQDNGVEVCRPSGISVLAWRTT